MRVIAGLLALAGSIAFDASALANDRPSPPLALSSDPPVPYPGLAVTADPLAPLTQRYEFRVDKSWRRAHSVFAAPSWRVREPSDAFALTIGYHLWPQGRGVSGFFAGAGFGALWLFGEPAPNLLAMIEMGYQYLWRGIAVGVQARLEVVHLWREPSTECLPSTGLLLGYAWG